MEDAALLTDAPADRRLRVQADLREALGSDVVMHFTLDAPPALTDDVHELQSDVGHEAVQAIEKRAQAGTTLAVARLNPRTRIRAGDTAELVIDTQRLHFFDHETGVAIYEGTSTT